MFLGNSIDGNPHLVMKIDYKNAAFAEMCYLKLSETFFRRYTHLCGNAITPNLVFLESLYFSQQQLGVQQGDPLGPALFSLAIHSLISGLSSDLNIWYLDDGTIGGKIDVFSDLRSIIQLSPSLGLELNVRSFWGRWIHRGS